MEIGSARGEIGCETKCLKQKTRGASRANESQMCVKASENHAGIDELWGGFERERDRECVACAPVSERLRAAERALARRLCAENRVLSGSQDCGTSAVGMSEVRGRGESGFETGGMRCVASPGEVARDFVNKICPKGGFRATFFGGVEGRVSCPLGEEQRNEKGEDDDSRVNGAGKCCREGR